MPRSLSSLFVGFSVRIAAGVALLRVERAYRTGYSSGAPPDHSGRRPLALGARLGEDGHGRAPWWAAQAEDDREETHDAAWLRRADPAQRRCVHARRAGPDPVAGRGRSPAAARSALRRRTSWRVSGVGELRLADPETFEPSNINRQFAAYVDTIGVNKAQAVAAELARINPAIVVRAFTEGVCDGSVAALLDGADVVVDGLDFFALETELLLHREAAARGQWVFAGQGVVEITTVTCFDPTRAALEDMVCDAGPPVRSPGPSRRSSLCCREPPRPSCSTRAVAGELPAVPSDVTGAALRRRRSWSTTSSAWRCEACPRTRSLPTSTCSTRTSCGCASGTRAEGSLPSASRRRHCRAPALVSPGHPSRTPHVPASRADTRQVNVSGAARRGASRADRAGHRRTGTGPALRVPLRRVRGGAGMDGAQGPRRPHPGRRVRPRRGRVRRLRRHRTQIVGSMRAVTDGPLGPPLERCRVLDGYRDPASVSSSSHGSRSRRSVAARCWRRCSMKAGYQCAERLGATHIVLDTYVGNGCARAPLHASSGSSSSPGPTPTPTTSGTAVVTFALDCECVPALRDWPASARPCYHFFTGDDERIDHGAAGGPASSRRRPRQGPGPAPEARASSDPPTVAQAVAPTQPPAARSGARRRSAATSRSPGPACSPGAELTHLLAPARSPRR